MTVLVLVEHDNASLNVATLSAVAAAQDMGGDIHMLVAGESCGAVAEEAARVGGVGKVLHADGPHLAHGLAEDLAALLAGLAANGAGGYSHLVATATTHGKNVMPRVAALLDVQQVSDITGVESADTLRPAHLRRQRDGDRALDRRRQGRHRAPDPRSTLPTPRAAQ